MRLNRLTRQVYAAVVAVVVLAIFGGLVALMASWRIKQMLATTVSRNVVTLLSEEEVAVALLEQRGLVATYILDNGNPHWLEELERRKPHFEETLARVRESITAEDDAREVEQLEAAYRRYDEQRLRAVRLFQEGKVDEAKQVVIADVNRQYREATAFCQSLTESGRQSLNATSAIAQQSVNQAMMTLVLTTLTILLLSGLALGLLYFRILQPLRGIVEQARENAGESFYENGNGDELRSVGRHLRGLMNDVASARSNLARTSARLAQSEKLASVGKLSASVAHEIRNPLTALNMWLFSIQKSIGPSPELDRKFAIVSDEMARLERIVNDFLDFSRPHPPNLRSQSAGELIERTLELIGPKIEARSLHVTRDVPWDVPPVLGDGDQLIQVLVNLLLNAVEACRPGGEIHVATIMPSFPDGRQVVGIRVEDNGPGIPAAVQDRIFEPFYTTRDHGTGLGLCIASQIMLNHGGWLELESSTSEGTTFVIWLPIAPAVAHEQHSHR